MASYNDPDFQAFVWALVQQESASSGLYSAVSPVGALGAYQVMPSNLHDWGLQATGNPVTPAEFLANPRLQDQIGQYKLLQDWNSHPGTAQVKVLATAHDWNPDANPATYGQKILGNFLKNPGKSFGVTTSTSTPLPPGPYAKGVLSKRIQGQKVVPPLTPAERKAIIQYMYDASVKNNLQPKENWQNLAWYEGHDDRYLIVNYEGMITGNPKGDAGIVTPGIGPVGIPNPLDFLKKAFDWLTNASNWKRIGLGVLGAAILIFVVLRYFKVSPTSMIPEVAAVKAVT